MAFFDLDLAQLREYMPERHEPADFDQFWQESLAATTAYPLNATFTPVDFGLQLLETFDVTFNGYGGQPIKSWLLLPRERVEPLPCVVEFIGYGGGRGLPTDWLRWVSSGVAHLVMDTRGQGSAWLHGDTPDLAPGGSSPQMPGFMTRGVLDPQTYYYRRLYLDGVRAVAAAKAHPAVDATRIAVTGASQGGGITLAVAGLDPSVKVAMPDVPFLCHFRRATDLVDTQPYFEITRFCRQHRHRVETVFETLNYFDGMHFAARATAVSLFSVGLMDDICPPSTVFAAYNHYQGPKSIEIYHYNNHEGGGSQHAAAKIRFFQRWLDGRNDFVEQPNFV